MAHTQAERLKREVKDDLLAREGVILVATDDETDELVIEVATDVPIDEAVGDVPDAFDGVAIRKQQGERMHVESASDDPGTANDPFARDIEARPVPLGVQILSGSAGYLVQDSSQYYILSNRHVFDAAVGTDIDQPLDGAAVGEIAGYLETGESGTDAAWTRINIGGAINYLHGLDATVSGEIYNPSQGDVITATTGYSGVQRGEIELVDAAIEIGDGQGGSYVLEDAMRTVGSVGTTGDSGSPWVYEDGTQTRPVGMHTAGSSTSGVAVDLEPIVQKTGLTIVTDPIVVEPAPDDPATNPEDVRDYTSLSFSTDTSNADGGAAGEIGDLGDLIIQPIEDVDPPAIGVVLPDGTLGAIALAPVSDPRDDDFFVTDEAGQDYIVIEGGV
jgi:hypothetical protein